MTPVASETPSPVGQDNWVAYVEEACRTATDLEKRVNAIEVYKRAVSAEPGSLRIWLAYCEYFHALHVACQTADPSWSNDEILMGREIFSLDADLQLWQSAYEDVRFRLSDSHVLWDRWVDIEMGLLSRTRTREGIERITFLYRDRLRTPHRTWDETSQRFSSFLSEYNRQNWESIMKEVTTDAQEAKTILSSRERFEFRLEKAVRSGDIEAERAAMKEYLAWEIAQTRYKDDGAYMRDQLCRGLFSRALTGPFATEDTVWLDYIAYLSSNLSPSKTAASLLSTLQRAVDHCPWSGPLWSRYILAAEEAQLTFAEIEQIKHAATNNSQIYRDGLTSLLEMYVAWCGYLKRTAMNPAASEEAVDVADVGLPAALESVDVLGKRLYENEYQGDPDFRLERIYIQYLTEKEGDLDEARAQWEKLARKPLYADRYDFWRAYYLWEMQVFFSRPKSQLGVTATTEQLTPSRATTIMSRAVNQRSLDWPERAITSYLQHCNDYELPNTIRRARDNVHKVRVVVAKRREREAAEAAAAYAQQAEAHQQAFASVAEETPEAHTALLADSPSGAKRKRDDTLGEIDEKTTKRPRSEGVNGEAEPSAKTEEAPHRDREHTTVLISNLPSDSTQTALKKYFKDFGRIQNITLVQDESVDTSTALIEFASVHDAEEAINFRDNKYFGQNQIRVKSGARLTLFVTNYPPAADDQYMRNLFRECGDILSIRWPSLKFNTRRRFCYLTFREEEAASKAVKLDGRLLEGKFKLEVKYSDPTSRRKRQGAVSEGREVRVANLDDSVKEEDIRDVFSKYGDIARVSTVASRRGKGFSSAFVEFEKKEYAERAIAELNNTKLRSRILTVELAVQPKVKVSAKVINADAEGHSPHAQDDEIMQDTPGEAAITETPSGIGTAQHVGGPIFARQVALMNLPDTINDARVKALLEPVGAFRKLVCQPRKGTAVVEFIDEATAGRASLQLDGLEIEGVRIRTGNLGDLAKYTRAHPESGTPLQQAPGKAKKPGEDNKSPSGGIGASNKPAFIPPVTVRRPVLGRGGKKGLSVAPRLSGARSSSDDPSGSASGGSKPGTEGRGAQSIPKPKSNADFKAIFLSGRPTASEPKQDGV
ncbi:hypothetical protein jhhlp_006037 [Lomentospora prolificans]|uniref:U4/U6 snRNA-associated-splicing factor PRP24 n=1 Tax=Lomentospora prolificans TaxID=41688 RepID=A0A2N3N4S4_9PEZI|nr:hypothetical protein jhhlp_006037 [Lomentospora prolificans]